VWITNPKSGCTMEMMAKEFMLAPAVAALEQRFGRDFVVVAYMNTSGRVKALAGRTGGAVCTSSNAGAVLRWALAQGRRIFFVPDEHLGRNVAAEVGIPPERIALLPGGHAGAELDAQQLAQLDRAQLILWGAFCGVHTVFAPRHVEYWRARGYQVVVHPECPREVAALADASGSTHFLWNHVMKAARGARFAVGTEGHFVRNLREQAALRGVEVVHLADVPGDPDAGCGCATMSRNDPPHLVALLDLLRLGRAPDLNRVLPGDAVDELSGFRERLDAAERARVAADARRALERMIEITEAAR
jgi:quinolinate synthase